MNARWPTPFASLLRHSLARPSAAPRAFPSRALCTSTPTLNARSTSFLSSYRLALAASLPAVALGLGLSSSRQQPLQCAADRSYAAPPPANIGGDVAVPVPQEAESIVNVRDLSFGTVAGICVGVFVKKGLKAIAFALGGVFVLLQYMSSRSFVNVNWNAISSSYDSVITKRAGPSTQVGGRITGLARWFTDFVSADVQARASFLLGMTLGFRLG